MILTHDVRLKILLFLMFGLMLTSFNFAISSIVGNWQTRFFFDHVLKYFEEYNKHTIKGELITPMLNNFKQARETLTESGNIDYLFLLIGIAASSVFFFMYKISKGMIMLENHKSSFNLKDNLKYPLFISLFFTVGLSFYFLTSSIESSMIETTSVILSSIQPFTDTRVPLDKGDIDIVMNETFGSKLSLISLLFVDKIADFSDSSYSQTYFFCIVGFLIIGILLYYVGNQFFADAFFISSLVGTVFWISYTALKIIPNL